MWIHAVHPIAPRLLLPPQQPRPRPKADTSAAASAAASEQPRAWKKSVKVTPPSADHVTHVTITYSDRSSPKTDPRVERYRFGGDPAPDKVQAFLEL